METYVTINRQNLVGTDKMAILACVNGKFVKRWETQANITDEDLISLAKEYGKVISSLKQTRERIKALGLVTGNKS